MTLKALSNMSDEQLVELKKEAISELYRLQNSDDTKSVEFWTALHASATAILKLRKNG